MLVPAGTSTSTFSLMKRTLGMSLSFGAEMRLDALGVCCIALDVGHPLTGQRAADALVHAPACELARQVVELLDPRVDGAMIVAAYRLIQRGDGGFDPL